MANIKHLTKTPGQMIEDENLKANVNLNLDKETYPALVVTIIREEDMTLSGELSILRKTLKAVCDQIGLSVEEFENYNTLAEEAKQKAKEQELHEPTSEE